MKKYQIIYADPAWHYMFGKTSSRYVDRKYNCMTKEELCDLPIISISADNAVLLMWVTYPMGKDEQKLNCLHELDWAFDVIRAWGFEYKTVAFTWVKTNKNSMGLFWGMGYYTRSNPEICLLATRGNPLPRISHSVHSVIMSPVQEHSKKPSETRDRIIELFGDLPRIELFARRKVEGWSCWGNEVESDIELPKARRTNEQD